MRIYLRLNLIALILISIIIVNAHTPLNTGDGNSTPDTATIIDNPTKSWTIYEELEDVDYYKLHLHTGEELRVSIYVSIWGETHFTPSLVVMGPDIIGDYEPQFIHPEELGRLIVPGVRPDHPEYEPFTPASYYYVASYSRIVSEEGDYYVAVFSEDQGGRYGMAFGYRETFTLYEWLKIPLDLVRIHLWEQQPLILLFGPPTAVIIFGIYYMYSSGIKNELSVVFGKLTSLLFIASGTMTLIQMIVYLWSAGLSGSTVITLFFVVAQLGLGSIGVRGSGKSWITWILLGIGGFVFWAGWILGPILAILKGVIQRLNIQDSQKTL